MRALTVASLKAVGLHRPAKSIRDALAPMHPRAIRDRRRKQAFYAQFVRPGDRCFDVGANVGDRTDIFLRLGACVVAIEPQEGCVRTLRQRFEGHANVTLVSSALGSRVGEQTMMTCGSSAMSSLSTEWIHAVQSSGRFAAYHWDDMITVPVTTLDALIREHGMPDFIKIDVEGYEYEVLSALAQPVNAVSFEFTPDLIDVAVRCVRHLDTLGTYAFNYSVGETMRWAVPAWLDADALCERLGSLGQPAPVGDVYARRIENSRPPT